MPSECVVQAKAGRCVVLATGLRFPEGPAFAPDGGLWLVELQGACLTHVRDGGRLGRHPVGGAPNGLAFDAAGRAWFCDAQQGAVRRYDPAAGATETMTHPPAGEPLNKPNDLAFAPDGTLVFTCPGDSRTEPTGTVWALRPDGALHCIAEGLNFPNGLAFAEGGATLIVAETYRHRLLRGAWDGARWINPVPWAHPGGPIGPDGMAWGADGLLYVAVFGQGCVQVFDPAGTLVGTHLTPGANPTNCAFDPSGRLGLVVTETERGELLSFPRLGPGSPLFPQ